MTGMVEFRKGTVAELRVLREIDDESGPMYLAAGIDLRDFDGDHPFVQAEEKRWGASLAAGRVELALVARRVQGFCVLDSADARPYLDQISVRADAMRRGIGSALVARAQQASGGELWLTTYAHLPWNGPYYEKRGFRFVSDAECGPEILAILASQRAAMPLAEQRVAMVWRA